MFHNFLTNENKRDFTPEINKNNTNIQNKHQRDIMPKYINIKKEIKKRASDLRKCFNIENTIFKEMQSKQNSLTYKELIPCLAKYFFGPNGIVTEKYKYLKDYYEELNLKIGLEKRIYAGRLDYFYLLSHYNSYSQRLNLTKEKILSLSNHLAVASSAFDKVNQKAINKARFFRKNKNYVNLKIKNSFSTGKIIEENNLNKEQFEKDLLTKNKKYKKLIYNNKFNNKESKIMFLSKQKMNNKSKLKLKKINSCNDYELNNNNVNITPEYSLSNNSFLNSTLTSRYTNKLNIKILKQKIENLKSKNNNNNINDLSNFSCSVPQIQNDDKSKESISDSKKIIESYSGYNIKDTLEKKINPIIYLNENSQKKLSYIKHKYLKSKNDKRIIKIMRKKNLLEILRDKEYYKSIKDIKTPKYSDIELPNKIKNLTLKNSFNVEFNN